MTNHPNDPLFGITLKQILEELTAEFTYEELSQDIHIKCFTENPSISSSLKFLRKTPWARRRVEDMYIEFKKL
jgi:uncharacterized protein (DUF2132 family)